MMIKFKTCIIITQFNLMTFNQLCHLVLINTIIQFLNYLFLFKNFILIKIKDCVKQNEKITGRTSSRYQ